MSLPPFPPVVVKCRRLQGVLSSVHGLGHLARQKHWHVA